ncbi:MAG: hypothetical protein O9340_15995 [Cyclobacteriaceae bacterium]|jgi:hypothetical protein|nr:hypothetical protein [Cyclobacteriaceae bacterium]
MNFRLFKILTFLIILNSCETEKGNTFHYTDIEPDKKITSMIPYPWTSADITENNLMYFGGEGPNSTIGSAWALQRIDINKDNEIDFDLGVKHSFEIPEIGQLNDEFIIYIGSWEDYQVSLADKTSGYIKEYQFGDEFDINTFGTNNGVSLNFPGGFLVRKDVDHDFIIDREFYIAVNLNRDGRNYYGWILVETNFLNLTIKEFAVSKIPDRIIKAGQRE